MSPLSRPFPLALTLVLGLGVVSCAVPPRPFAESPAHRLIGSASLLLMPHVEEGTLTQALVTRPRAANIHRLVVIPMVETTPGQYQPFTADGTPTALGDAQAVSLSRTVPELNLSKGLLFTGLAPQTRYRILARAYDAQGKLLSKDADSTVDVAVTTDDAPTSTALPVVLADVPFAAKTTITLANGPSPSYTSVVTSLVTVASSTETPVSGTSQTFNKAQMPMVLTLDGLLADTTYRLNASLRDGSNAEVATASVEIAVTHDDAPTGKTLTLNVVSNAPPQITTFAGAYPTATSGSTNASGTSARFNYPTNVAIDASGNRYVADMVNHTIRKISPAGVVTTLAGSSNGYLDGTGTAAKFSFPFGIAVDTAGNVYVADRQNHAIRKITPAGVVTTLAGNYPGAFEGYTDATGTAAKFRYPTGLTLDSAGNLYVSDRDNRAIRKVTPAGVVTTLAGGTQGFLDGTGTAARFNEPHGIARDSAGNLYVADSSNHAIRKITSAGVVTTLAGAGLGNHGYVDGSGMGARFLTPHGIAVDSTGHVFVADTYNHAIRKITPAGVVTTVLGAHPTAISGFLDGIGTSTRFQNPHGVALDASDKLYVVDTFNHAIRKVQ